IMPPISGMQAIAAATFEGKPVDVDFGPGSGPGLGGGAGGIGSSSGITYIHKMPVALSSNLTLHAPFRFHSGVKANIVPFKFNRLYDQQPFPRVYSNRIARRNRDDLHPRRADAQYY